MPADETSAPAGKAAHTTQAGRRCALLGPPSGHSTHMQLCSNALTPLSPSAVSPQTQAPHSSHRLTHFKSNFLNLPTRCPSRSKKPKSKLGACTYASTSTAETARSCFSPPSAGLRSSDVILCCCCRHTAASRWPLAHPLPHAVPSPHVSNAPMARRGPLRPCRSLAHDPFPT